MSVIRASHFHNLAEALSWSPAQLLWLVWVNYKCGAAARGGLQSGVCKQARHITKTGQTPMVLLYASGSIPVWMFTTHALPARHKSSQQAMAPCRQEISCSVQSAG
jgi:hypothetical protein